MIKDVSATMRTFFVPQLEQLGLTEIGSRHGSLSCAEGEWGKGRLWAISLGDDCLFTAHDLELTELVVLTEQTRNYLCISSMTKDSASMCPVYGRLFSGRNVVSFRDRGKTSRYMLSPGEQHHSFTLCLLPSCIDRMTGLNDEEKERVCDYLAESEPNTLPVSVAKALESLDPSLATSPGGREHCRAKVSKVLSVIIEDALASEGDEADEAAAEARRIANEARSIMDARYCEQLTCRGIADELFVGRSRLCEVFKQELGMCVAEYLRNRRLQEAAKLLREGDCSIAGVSAAVGYSSVGSFADAFKRIYGLTPGGYRKHAHET